MSTEINVVLGDDGLVSQARRTQVENRKKQLEGVRQSAVQGRIGRKDAGKGGAGRSGKRLLRPTAYGGGVTAGIVGLQDITTDVPFFLETTDTSFIKAPLRTRYIISGNNNAKVMDEVWAKAQENPYGFVPVPYGHEFYLYDPDIDAYRGYLPAKSIYLQTMRAALLPYGGKACIHVAAGHVRIYRFQPQPARGDLLYDPQLSGETVRDWASAHYVDEDRVVPIRMPSQLADTMLASLGYTYLTNESFFNEFIGGLQWFVQLNSFQPPSPRFNVGGLFDGYGWYKGNGISPGIYVGIEKRDDLGLPPSAESIFPNYPGLGYSYVTPLMPGSAQTAGTLAFAADPARAAALVLVRDPTIPDELGEYVLPPVPPDASGEEWQEVNPEVTMPINSGSPGSVQWVPFTDWSDPGFCLSKLEALGFTEADFNI
jgi:hypothetical protein